MMPWVAMPYWESCCQDLFHPPEALRMQKSWEKILVFSCEPPRLNRIIDITYRLRKFVEKSLWLKKIYRRAFEESNSCIFRIKKGISYSRQGINLRWLWDIAIFMETCAV